MAIVNSLAKTQVEAGMPPYLSAQLQRGQVLKKTIVYKAGTTATAASSTIMDIPLPPGVVIDVSSIACTHDGIGAGNLTLGLEVHDKRGDKVNGDGFSLPALTVTTTAGEIVRVPSTTSFGSKVLWDPAQFLVDNSVLINGTAATYALLKEKYDFVLTITNSATIAANKQFVIVMDLVIP
ncbi:hypothetical protein [Veillonella sp.]|uniref:hypothetical protein n=1 Tax=Veillonella sp. TaxID=1926307 RepID=UPI0025806B79|nr:hypothetical protein [Veillonella sp.]MBS6486231.1 hypothetical protein [Veillonella sp.]